MIKVVFYVLCTAISPPPTIDKPGPTYTCAADRQPLDQCLHAAGSQQICMPAP